MEMTGTVLLNNKKSPRSGALGLWRRFLSFRELPLVFVLFERLYSAHTCAFITDDPPGCKGYAGGTRANIVLSDDNDKPQGCRLENHRVQYV